MKSELLHDLWSSPDNSRLITKQFSFRLPVHIAAKIAALGEMYPQKNRTQIVADLLATALDDLEKKLPCTVVAVDEHTQKLDDEYNEHHGYELGTLYTLGGARAKFRSISNQYFSEFEKELGNEQPTQLFEAIAGSKVQVEESLK